MAILMSRAGSVRFVLLVLLLAGAGGGGAWLFADRGQSTLTVAAQPVPERSAPAPPAISVVTVYPRRDTSSQLTVERPADVEAYYRADLEAQVAGQVRWVRVAPGSLVEKDQLLVRIHVPDKLALVREMQNVVGQRQREYELAQEKQKAAEDAVNTGLSNVELKRALLQEAKAETKLRDIKFQNLDQLLQKASIEKIYRDEGLRSLEVAREIEVGADAARVKAEKEVAEARTNVRVMAAEANRARQAIEVAKSEAERAAAVADYADVKAPFRGAVVRRLVDPGSFVQNASTGRATPMLTVQRSDIVTVVMNVPDNYASHVAPGTEAVIELNAMPGTKIHGKVTRFAPSLVTPAHDRTMRVEVDLWNDAAENYAPFFADPKNLADLKEGPLPLLPEYKGKVPGSAAPRLLPGTFGRMTLILKSFGQIELIPSPAVMRSGGRASIYVVRDGKAHRLPVEVQGEDGSLAHVLVLDKNGEILGQLAEREQVIVSNQEELSEGQLVNPVPRADPASPPSR